MWKYICQNCQIRILSINTKALGKKISIGGLWNNLLQVLHFQDFLKENKWFFLQLQYSNEYAYHFYFLLSTILGQMKHFQQTKTIFFECSNVFYFQNAMNDEKTNEVSGLEIFLIWQLEPEWLNSRHEFNCVISPIQNTAVIELVFP